MAQLVKNLPSLQEAQVRFLDRKSPWRKERLPTPVFRPGEFHGLYSPWGHKEPDTSEQLAFFKGMRALLESYVNPLRRALLPGDLPKFPDPKARTRPGQGGHNCRTTPN